MSPKQTVMTTLLPPLTVEQDAALLWLEALVEQKDAKFKADNRRDELIQIMNKRKKDRVIVVDDNGWKHTFEIEVGNPKVSHSQVLEPKITRAADDLKA